MVTDLGEGDNKSANNTNTDNFYIKASTNEALKKSDKKSIADNKEFSCQLYEQNKGSSISKLPHQDW